VARTVLGTYDIDCRARPHSAEETDFLAHTVAGSRLGVTFADLGTASHIVLVGFEPEEEGGIVYLRLREAAAQGAQITAIAPYASLGVRRLGARLVQIRPGAEATALDTLTATVPAPAPAKSTSDRSPAADSAADAAPLAGTIILLGERLALSPGAFTSALAAKRRGARLAWIPRRAGERGAIDVGCLPGPLPSALTGIVADPARGAEGPGRDTTAILAGAMAGDIGAILIGGVEIEDLPAPVQARAALDRAFTVSLEVLPSAVTALADVVLPVAPPAEKPGTYMTWEGRLRPFPQVLTTTAMPDAKVLAALAAALGVPVDLSLAGAHAALAAAGRPGGQDSALPPSAADAAAPADEVPAGTESSPTAASPVKPVSPVPTPPPAPHPAPVAGEALLASWHVNLDAGRLQSCEPHLAATAKAPYAVLSASTAFEIDVRAGDGVQVSTPSGTITVPVRIADIPDRVVWLPTNSPGCQVRATLGVSDGIVQIEAAPRGATPPSGAQDSQEVGP
jgi:NADH-quinone oxidoreductase subunit G